MADNVAAVEPPYCSLIVSELTEAYPPLLALYSAISTTPPVRMVIKSAYPSSAISAISKSMTAEGKVKLVCVEKLPVVPL